MSNTSSHGTNSPGSGTGQSPSGTDPLQDRLRAATLGDYDVYGELGRGGMATVYLAHELALDRKVAIKVMSPALTHGAGMVERFKREARTAANLSHPNIIPIYSVREADGLLFFVMKVVEGTPLDSIMRELGKLPIPMVEAILAQVGSAFGYAHRRGVIHRDIKPSNILIDEEGWAVVTDFGIAKVQETEGLTQTGTAVGTPTYMSPEQCGGGVIAGASDQYSLGVVAYEMLTGRPPFSGSMMALMYSHFHETVPPIELERHDCPEPLRNAVMRMLQKDPGSRWPSMEEAVAAMGARHMAHDDPTRTQLILLARSGSTHKVVSQVQTPRSPIPLAHRTGGEPRATGSLPPVRRRRGWLIAAGAAVVLTAAAVVFLPMSAPRAPAVADSASLSGTPPLAPPPTAETQSLPPAQPGPSIPGRRSEPRTPATQSAGPRVGPVAPRVESVTPGPAPEPAPPPPAPAPAAVQAPVPPPRSEPEVTVSPPPPPPVVDDRAGVAAAITAYAQALEKGDLNQASRLYPGMPPDQRQGLVSLWQAGGSLRPQWSISDVIVSGDVATARVSGSTTFNTPRERPSVQRVSLRARLERRGTEWRLVALVN